MGRPAHLLRLVARHARGLPHRKKRTCSASRKTVQAEVPGVHAANLSKIEQG